MNVRGAMSWGILSLAGILLLLRIAVLLDWLGSPSADELQVGILMLLLVLGVDQVRSVGTLKSDVKELNSGVTELNNGVTELKKDVTQLNEKAHTH